MIIIIFFHVNKFCATQLSYEEFTFSYLFYSVMYLFVSKTFDYRVPTTGGKPLDLHRLFVEVTFRGGLQKVGDNYFIDNKYLEKSNILSTRGALFFWLKF